MSAAGVESKVAALSPLAASFYFDGRGWTLVVPGHGHSPESLAELADEEWGSAEHQSAEEWFSLHKRIKRCDRLDGFGCDLEGEWHRHLDPSRPNDQPGQQWTVIWPAPTGAGGETP